MSANKKYAYRLLDHAEDVQDVLRNDAYPPYSMADEYRLLSKRFNLDFSATIQLCETLPVFLSGITHKEIRKSMATSMALLKSEQELSIVENVQNLDKLLISGYQIDLKNEFIRPLWRSFVNVDGYFSSDGIDLIEEIPYLFSKHLSLKKRIEINDRLSIFLSTFESEDQRVWLRLGHHVLGYTPLIESLTLSLYQIFKENIGVSLKDIRYPSEILVSAVPRTDRWMGDELVGCPLYSEGYSKEINQQYMFGIGSHVCLGGPISRFIWPQIIKRLALCSLAIDSVDLKFVNSSSSDRNSDLDKKNLLNDPFTRTKDFRLFLKSA